MSNKAFLWSYAVITWVYIIGSMTLPMITTNLGVLLGFVVAMLISMIATAMIRARAIGRSPFYGMGIMVPVWQMFVLVNLGK